MTGGDKCHELQALHSTRDSGNGPYKRAGDRLVIQQADAENKIRRIKCTFALSSCSVTVIQGKWTAGLAHDYADDVV